MRPAASAPSAGPPEITARDRWTDRRDVLRAECTKLRSLRSVWLPLVAAAVIAGTAAVVTALAHPRAASCAGGCSVAGLALSGVRLGMLVVVAHATLAMTAEYERGSILTTLLATPRRVRLLAAKAIAVSAAAAGGGVIGVAGSLAIGRIQLVDRGFTPANGYQPLTPADVATARAAVGSVIYIVLVALISLGVATITRRSRTALSAMLSVLYLVPLLALVVPSEPAQRAITRYAPASAGLAIQATDAQATGLGPWAGLALLTTYAGATLVVAAMCLTRRDA